METKCIEFTKKNVETTPTLINNRIVQELLEVNTVVSNHEETLQRVYEILSPKNNRVEYGTREIQSFQASEFERFVAIHDLKAVYLEKEVTRLKAITEQNSS